MSNIQVTKQKQFTGFNIQICFCKPELCSGPEYSSFGKGCRAKRWSVVVLYIMGTNSLIILN